LTFKTFHVFLFKVHYFLALSLARSDLISATPVFYNCDRLGRMFQIHDKTVDSSYFYFALINRNFQAQLDIRQLKKELRRREAATFWGSRL
jgi:hypothetical protein